MTFSIGPFKSGDNIRIPLEVSLNEVPISMSDPRVERIIAPNLTNLSGFPVPMNELKTGVYYYEITLSTIGNYTVIVQAEYEGTTVESVVAFVIEAPTEFGQPRIAIACD